MRSRAAANLLGVSYVPAAILARTRCTNSQRMGDVLSRLSVADRQAAADDMRLMIRFGQSWDIRSSSHAAAQ
jgi:hypothetical protein